MKEFEVTLAHKRSDRLNIEEGVYIQPKLDGVRCYTRLVDGEIKMFSRNHKEFKNVKHITTELGEFFKWNPDSIIDGELYNHKFRDNFNKIISLVRKQKPTQADRFEASSSLQYHVYDLFNPNQPDVDYKGRYNTIFRQLSGLRSVKRIKNNCATSQKAIDMIHKINKQDGYEGSMLRANEPYQQKRSHGLQKVKDWHDTEFTITGFIEGKGKFQGGLGKFLGKDESGRAIEVPYPNITITDRKLLWQDKDYYLGKTATFEYFERTPAGAYRFPRFKAIRNYE